MRWALSGLLLLSLDVPAPPAGCPEPAQRQFDFWIGDWTVTDSAGAQTFGHNLVTLEEAGCLIHEHWTGQGGGTGQSFNYYEPSATEWRQIWVASRGTVLQLAGGLVGSSMVLTGKGGSTAGSPASMDRIAWTPEPDGRVRQQWSTSTDSGRTWQVTFDGWYRKP
ncbi:MAG TPA: hypothetical protein VMG41_11970 [Gemmatimonadales bacterium]|nr:hypothetical protein [Gemmatimonadales bacterium]